MAKHIERLQKVVDEILAGQSTLRVLEAGCGSMSFMDLKPPTRITGIGMSNPRPSSIGFKNESLTLTMSDQMVNST